jgi:putative addiction module component (TIGR02574 family)
VRQPASTPRLSNIAPITSLIKTIGGSYFALLPEPLEKGLKVRDTRPMSVAAIQNEIPSLSPEERVKLIDLLWDSLSAPELKAREAAWAAESERRIDAFDAGKLESRSAEEVLADLRNTLRK